MGILTPIHEVTRVLKLLLKTKMEIKGVEISSSPLDLVPEQKVKRINMYLYNVQENLNLKIPQVPDHNPSPDTSLSLNLNYIITPFSDKNKYNKDYDINLHELLTDAMHVFHNYPVIDSSTEIQGSGIKLINSELHNQIEKLKIIFNPLDAKELMEIWKGFTLPYHLSVVYEVSTEFKG